MGYQWGDFSPRNPREGDWWAASDRGWLSVDHLKGTIANYLDYGPNHYRSGHDYCKDGDCREWQPGNVHVCVYRCSQDYQDYGQSYGSHYFSTVEEAKTWAEQRAREVGLILPEDSHV